MTRRLRCQMGGQAQGSYIPSPTKFLKNKSENDGGERSQVVTRDIAGSFQEIDSLLL
jgi:hypothetical protein